MHEIYNIGYAKVLYLQLSNERTCRWMRDERREKTPTYSLDNALQKSANHRENRGKDPQEPPKSISSTKT